MNPDLAVTMRGLEEEIKFPEEEEMSGEKQALLHELKGMYQAGSKEVHRGLRNRVNAFVADTFPERTAAMVYTLETIEAGRSLPGSTMGNVFVQMGDEHLQNNNPDPKFSVKPLHDLIPRLPLVAVRSKLIHTERSPFEQIMDQCYIDQYV